MTFNVLKSFSLFLLNAFLVSACAGKQHTRKRRASMLPPEVANTFQHKLDSYELQTEEGGSLNMKKLQLKVSQNINTRFKDVEGRSVSGMYLLCNLTKNTSLLEEDVRDSVFTKLLSSLLNSSSIDLREPLVKGRDGKTLIQPWRLLTSAPLLKQPRKFENWLARCCQKGMDLTAEDHEGNTIMNWFSRVIGGDARMLLDKHDQAIRARVFCYVCPEFFLSPLLEYGAPVSTEDVQWLFHRALHNKENTVTFLGGVSAALNKNDIDIAAIMTEVIYAIFNKPSSHFIHFNLDSSKKKEVLLTRKEFITILQTVYPNTPDNLANLGYNSNEEYKLFVMYQLFDWIKKQHPSLLRKVLQATIARLQLKVLPVWPHCIMPQE